MILVGPTTVRAFLRPDRKSMTTSARANARIRSCEMLDTHRMATGLVSIGLATGHL
jgi:hypothetical protein